MQHRIGQIEVTCQVFQRASKSAEGVFLRSALVVSLFLARCPSAIGRFVISVIVDSVNRMLSRGPESHIGMEVFEGIKPALTDCDSSSAVDAIAMIVQPRASVDHIGPDTVFRRFTHLVCGFCGQHFSFDASARVCALKISSLDQFDCPTRALTSVFRVSRVDRIGFERKDGEASMNSSDRYFGLNHGSILPYLAESWS